MAFSIVSAGELVRASIRAFNEDVPHVEFRGNLLRPCDNPVERDVDQIAGRLDVAISTPATHSLDLGRIGAEAVEDGYVTHTLPVQLIAFHVEPDDVSFPGPYRPGASFVDQGVKADLVVAG